MKARKVYYFLVISLLLTILSFAYVNKPTTLAANDNVLRLEPPPFVSAASPAPELTQLNIGTLLDDEAGISAWYQSPDAINLNQVRDLFDTIEDETTEYIIGSVDVPYYVDHFDAHVFVHVDGWILAYYLRGEPTSKIVDVKASTINTTKLKTVVGAVAGAAGAPFADVNYYDFRYPNATHIMFVAEDEGGGNSFTIQIPSSFGYHELGWALYRGTANSGDYFRVDGVNKRGQATYCGDGTCYGTLTLSELLPDISHTIAVNSYWSSAYGVLVVTYRVP